MTKRYHSNSMSARVLLLGLLALLPLGPSLAQTDGFSPLGKDAKKQENAFEPQIERLKADLQNPDPKVRLKAIRNLQKIPKPTSAMLDIIKATQDVNLDVHRQANCSLGFMGVRLESTAISALVEALQDEDRQVRSCAAMSLTSLGHSAPESAVNALIKALGDRDNVVSANAAGALGAMGNAARIAIPALKALKQQGKFASSTAEQSIKRILAES